MLLPDGDEFPVLSIAGDELRLDRKVLFFKPLQPFPSLISLLISSLEENVDNHNMFPCIWRVVSHGFNQLWTENIWNKISVCIDSMQSDDYLYSTDTMLGIINHHLVITL